MGLKEIGTFYYLTKTKIPKIPQVSSSGANSPSETLLNAWDARFFSDVKSRFRLFRLLSTALESCKLSTDFAPQLQNTLFSLHPTCENFTNTLSLSLIPFSLSLCLFSLTLSLFYLYHGKTRF